jgi:hypothetical protein
MSNDNNKIHEEAFARWWASLTYVQRVGFDKHSCWVGFLAGASHGVQQVSKLIAETLT